MRRIFLVAIMPLVGLAAWNSEHVTRASLGITTENSVETVCKAPVLPDLRAGPSSGPEAGCTEPGGCENKEHISAVFLPYAIASLNAYGASGRRSGDLNKYDPTWTMIGEPVALPNGLGYTAFSRTVNNEDHILVAFRGTDPLGDGDWLELIPHPTDAIANASWITQWFNPWDQYRGARQAFAEIRKQAFARANGRVVRFHVTGHSLGGGLAVHIARGFPCTAAVVFNPSCVSNQIRYAQRYEGSQIVDIRENRDWLSKSLCLPATLLGWGRNHQIYEADWIRDRARRNQDEMDVALRQHQIGSMTFGMGRTVLCCIQNQRRSSHSSCACGQRVMAEVDGVKRMLCDMRRRPPLRTTNDAERTVQTTTRKGTTTEKRRPRIDSCDFTPVEQVDSQCLRPC
jgi:pimeloyl-ACP methyl ester carboxylesterase